MAAITRRFRRAAMVYQLQAHGVRWWGTSYRDIRRAWLEKFGDPLQRLLLSRGKNQRGQLRMMPGQREFMESQVVLRPRGHGKVPQSWMETIRKLFGVGL